MDRLLNYLPTRAGSILDVACGKGGITRYLLRYFAPQHVTAINISDKQLRRARQNAPGCTFLNMDATDLKFNDDQFDYIICVEAAFHFDTREKFLNETLRVLKPGGCLVMSDMLIARTAGKATGARPENFVKGIEAFRDLFETIGFCSVDVEHVTEECWLRFYDYAIRLARKRFRNGQIGFATLRRIIRIHNQKLRDVRFCVLVSAAKPLTEQLP